MIFLWQLPDTLCNGSMSCNC